MMQRRKLYLIYSGPGIGDIIMSLTLAKKMSTIEQNCTIDFLVHSTKNKGEITNELMQYQDYVRKIFLYNSKEPIKLIKTIFSLKIKKYDAAFLCKHMTEDESKTPLYISKIICSNTIGPNNAVSRLKYRIPIFIEGEKHVCETFCMLAKPYTDDLAVDINVLNRNKINKIASRYDKLLNKQKYIVLCIGTGALTYKIKGKNYIIHSKEWPSEKWLDLLSMLKDNNIKAVLIGNSIDCNDSSMIINLTGKTSISESLKIVLNAEVIVGGDTGMLHCAAALNKVTISLFGMTNPKEYAPYGDKNILVESDNKCYCFGTRESVKCKFNACMNNIEPQMVLNEIIKVWEDKYEKENC